MAGEPVRATARDVLYTLPLVGGEAPLPVRAAARLPKPAPVGRLRRFGTKTQSKTIQGRGRSPQQEKS